MMATSARITVSLTADEARYLRAAGEQAIAAVEHPCPCHHSDEVREVFRGHGLRFLCDAVGTLAEAVEAWS